jgi:hypothetical protein
MDQPLQPAPVAAGQRRRTHADRVCRPQPAQPAPHHFDEAELARSGAVDPSARHRAAGRRRTIAWLAATKSSLASGVGAPRSCAGVLPISRSSFAMSTTARRSKSPSSKTSSAPISIALEEALGYEQLIARSWTIRRPISAKSSAKAAAMWPTALRLLKLPEPVRDMLSSGTLSAGHARALIPTSDPSRWRARSSPRVFRYAIQSGWRRTI